MDLDLDLLTVRRCCGGRVVAHHEYAYAATFRPAVTVTDTDTDTNSDSDRPPPARRYFSSAAATPQGRLELASHIQALYQQFGLDGIDIDWEYPGQGGDAGNGVSPDDSANFLAFLQTLRALLPSGAVITAATQTVPFAGADGRPMADVAAFADVLDWVLVMNYDTSGCECFFLVGFSLVQICWFLLSFQFHSGVLLHLSIVSPLPFCTFTSSCTPRQRTTHIHMPMFRGVSYPMFRTYLSRTNTRN